MSAHAFDRTAELTAMKQAARDATRLVMKIYESGFLVEWKGKDDPVTTADREANAQIVATLSAAFPSHGFLAEESAPETAEELRRAQSHERFFCVDPIAGTREFVDRNGEFCVMIGLAQGVIGGANAVATLGVIAVPAADKLFFGGPGVGCFVEPLGGGDARSLALTAPGESLRALISRSHPSARTASLLDALGVSERIRCGSVGVKATRILEGQADLYVHPSKGCKLWDGCAPDALLQGAGGVLVDLHGAPIDYRGPLGLDSGIIAAHASLAQRIADAARSTLN